MRTCNVETWPKFIHRKAYRGFRTRIRAANARMLAASRNAIKKALLEYLHETEQTRRQYQNALAALKCGDPSTAAIYI